MASLDDRRRRHRDGIHRHRPRRGAAADRRPGPRRARQHAGAWRGTGRRRSASATPTPRSTTCWPTTAVDVVHVTSPNDLHVSQARAVLAAGKHVVCEKPLAMTADESAELVRPGRRDRPASTRRTSTSATTRSTSTPRELIADGGLGEVRLVTGRYFQDWLLLDSDWNWRLAARPRRRAAGGRRHRLALARPHDLRHRPARQPRSWPTSRRSSRRASEPTGPVETFSTERSADTVERADRDRGHGDDPPPLRRRRARRREHLADQRRPEELARLRDRRLRRRLGAGTREQPDQAWHRPPRPRPTRSSSATRP